MKRGDKWNWASATLAIMLLFFAGNFLILDAIGAEKYRGAFVLLALNVWPAGLCLIGTGVLSALRRQITPVIGSLLGIGLFCGVVMAFVIIIFLMAFLATVLLPESIAVAPFRILTILIFLVLPLLSLAFACIRQPRMKGSNNHKHGTGEELARP